MTDQEFLALSRCTLFKNIKTGELKTLFRDIPYTLKNFDSEAVVKIRGEKYESLLIVIKGELDASINDLSGKTIKMETLKSPAIAASGILFAGDPFLPVTLTAGKNTKILSIPRKSVLDLCIKSREILINYLSDSGDKIAFLAEKIRLFKFSNLRQKTAGYLLDLTERYNSCTVKLPYTKETIAEIFGVTRPSLSRIFSELAKEGIISTSSAASPGTIVIRNREALLSILSDISGS